MKRRGVYVAMIALIACGRLSSPGPDTIALIDGDALPWARFEAYLEATGGSGALGFSSSVSSQLLDQFLDEELLRREAVARGLITAEASGREAVAALVKNAVGAVPTAAAVRLYYEQHNEEFMAPDRVHLRQILLDDRQSAERAERELAQGVDFATVARHWSIDPSREHGGDQGVLSRDDLPTSLAETILALAPGQTSGIVETEYGFHIFQVVARWPAGPVPLERAESRIRQRLRRQATESATRRLVAAARRRYNVRVVGRNLPFTYSGEYPVERE
jgi:parvulin-like peptidyl-prolyl isomerase